VKELDAAELVCGDIIEVGEGQQVPTDARLLQIKSTTLTADQAALAGESVGGSKQLEAVDPKAMLHEKTCVCFGGTPVVRGRFVGVVIGVGHGSEIGNIQKSVSAMEEQETPLQIKLDAFGGYISKGIGVICIVTWLVSIPKFTVAGKGNPFWGALSFFKIAVSLAVAAIPDGLPAVVTTTLSLGVKRMAEEKAIVTKLPAVETLGCTSVICSDKTGTLTQNSMNARAFVVISDGHAVKFEVEGSGYQPQGKFKSGKSAVSNLHEHRALQESAKVATLCNNSTLLFDPDSKRVTETAN
jgi:Ca2+ transporting ATPase